MSTHPALMSDALDDLADAEASAFHDEMLEQLETLQANAPSMEDFESLFGKVHFVGGSVDPDWMDRYTASQCEYKVCCETGHTSSARVALHNVSPEGKAYRVDPDSPSAKAARHMRKSEGL